MGDFDEWVYDQRQKMMTACKANHDHTLRYVVTVENAAREGHPCPDVPRKFRRLSLKLGVAIEKITRKTCRSGCQAIRCEESGTTERENIC
eukprot:6475803-Amphidinium_carterae.3